MRKEVGNFEKKAVSYENAGLFNKAKEILENEQQLSHIGWSGVGKFIDYLETFYNLEKVTWTVEDFLNVDRELVEELGIIACEGQAHIAEILKTEQTSIEDVDGSFYRVFKVKCDEQKLKDTGYQTILLSKVE